MGENSRIEWCDHTFNPWTGCTKVSPGCAKCYAETMSRRLPQLGRWGPGGERKRTSAANWRKPLSWNRIAGAAGGPRYRPRVFCASLADWLDAEIPAQWLADLLDLIHATPHLDWLLLTKRPELWRERLAAALAHAERLAPPAPGASMVRSWLYHGYAPANVWIGTTVEDQRRADERIPALVDIPARVQFLSCEPLLEQVNLDLDGINWVICGGESGHGARPMHPDWARSLRDQCQAAGVAYFFKQWGEWAPAADIDVCDPVMGTPVTSARYHALPGGSGMLRVGKAAAGRELDGRTWDEVPT